MEQAVSDVEATLSGDQLRPHLDCNEAEDLLALLADRQLVQPLRAETYQVHDLLRVFAREMYDQYDEESADDGLSRTALGYATVAARSRLR